MSVFISPIVDAIMQWFDRTYGEEFILEHKRAIWEPVEILRIRDKRTKIEIGSVSISSLMVENKNWPAWADSAALDIRALIAKYKEPTPAQPQNVQSVFVKGILGL
jgi:hypothetical protein